MTKMPDTLRRALNYLTLEQEFFACLLFEMRLKEVTEPPKRLLGRDLDQGAKFTMGTDGKSIFYSREFVESITVPVCVFALAHEVSHPMLQHLTRLYEHGISGSNWTPKADSNGRLICRDPTLWNIAGDFVINQFLKDANFTLWNQCLHDPKYSGWTTEKVYEDLLSQSKNSKSQAKLLMSSPTGADLCEPDSATDMQAEAEEWKERIVRAAQVAKARGHLPSSIENMVKEFTEPQYPVWLLLERYVDSVIRDDDYSWYRPHQYFMNMGIIMPGAFSEKVSHVSMWYDTSGSVSDEDLAKFHRVGGDIIRNAAPALLTLGQCDASVHAFAEIKTQGDWLSEIKVTGRGGTSFKPPFDYLASHHLSPSLMIYLTDLEGDFPDTPPPFPVLWVSTTSHVAPFGTTIHLNQTR